MKHSAVPTPTMMATSSAAMITCPRLSQVNIVESCGLRPWVISLAPRTMPAWATVWTMKFSIAPMPPKISAAPKPGVSSVIDGRMPSCQIRSTASSRTRYTRTAAMTTPKFSRNLFQPQLNAAETV
jgi:hypothetical protein